MPSVFIWLVGVACSAAALAQPPSLAGTWAWGVGAGTVEIDSGGAGRDSRGNTMKWTVRDATTRTYTLVWSHGYTDTATLSGDGNSLRAVNTSGTQFTATRVLPRAVVSSSDGAIVGTWDWGAGGTVVEINSAGGGRDAGGNSLRWTLRDAGARTYTLVWSHGYTDTATLSADGNTVTAVNNQDMRFSATRRKGERPVPPGVLDLNGSWSGGLVHIWQDGTQILATAAWKRGDRFVVTRAEGRLNGRVIDLVVRYSPMPNGPEPEYRGVLTVAPDGNTIDAVYSISGVTRDRRTYSRDR